MSVTDRGMRVEGAMKRLTTKGVDVGKVSTITVLVPPQPGMYRYQSVSACENEAITLAIDAFESQRLSIVYKGVIEPKLL